MTACEGNITATYTIDRSTLGDLHDLNLARSRLLNFASYSAILLTNNFEVE